MQDRIITDSSILLGKPVVAGTRLSVEHVIGLLADGWTESEIVENHPPLTPADIRACLSYARQLLQDERVFTVAA